MMADKANNRVRCDEDCGDACCCDCSLPPLTREAGDGHMKAVAVEVRSSRRRRDKLERIIIIIVVVVVVKAWYQGW